MAELMKSKTSSLFAGIVTESFMRPSIPSDLPEVGQEESGERLMSYETSNLQIERPDSEGPETEAPFVVRVEEDCEDCGGSGYDCGSLSPIEPEDCPVCHGGRKQIVIRNYLAEAFRIAAGRSSKLAQREHLLAVIQHCRSLVGALMSIADIH
jgi:hypothetical protein